MPEKMFNIIGVDKLLKKLRGIGSGLKNRRTAHARIVAMLDGMIQRNFQQEGKLLDGSGWVPLAPSTIEARKRNKKGNVRILQDTGMLRSRWKHLYDNNKAMIQSGVPYGIYHDSDKPRKKLPQRKILPRPAQYMPKVNEIYKNFIKDVLK